MHPTDIVNLMLDQRPGDLYDAAEDASPEDLAALRRLAQRAAWVRQVKAAANPDRQLYDAIRDIQRQAVNADLGRPCTPEEVAELDRTEDW